MAATVPVDVDVTDLLSDRSNAYLFVFPPQVLRLWSAATILLLRRRLRPPAEETCLRTVAASGARTPCCPSCPGDWPPSCRPRDALRLPRRKVRTTSIKKSHIPIFIIVSVSGTKNKNFWGVCKKEEMVFAFLFF